MKEMFAEKFDSSAYQIEDMISQIGFVESNNQNIPQKGGGPGRGFFQFETKKGSGAFQTALNRVTNRYKAVGEKVPEWVGKAKDADNAMVLTREQQEDVLLADLWYKKGSDPLIKKAVETGSAKELWLQKHWAGAPVGSEGYEKKASQWDKHMRKYKSPEPIKNVAVAARDEIKKNANVAFDKMEEVNKESDVNIYAMKDEEEPTEAGRVQSEMEELMSKGRAESISKRERK